MRLLEREREVDVLRGALRRATEGHGVGIAVAGESGAGKTTVVASALEDAERDLRVLRGHCDPLQTPRPLGPFRGIGLRSLDTPHGDASVRSSELFDRVFTEISSEPTVLVIEDLHWLDEVSAELLRFLARRIEAIPLALVVTYRDLEIGLRHPVRPLLGDFASLDGLETLALTPLSVDAVRELVAGSGLDPARVHTVTGGNPFFVTAVAREPDLPMPGSVRDAVLARFAEIEPDDLEVLQLVATAPDGLDDAALPRLGVGLPTLRRLDAAALLTRSAAGLVFRHELARLAVLSTIPPGGETVLHTRVLDALEQIQPRDPAVLTHHAVNARDAARALQYARSAAEEAIAASSNTEAAAFVQIALSNLPIDAAPPERAELLARLSRLLYLTGRLAAAIDAARASIPLWRTAGNPAGIAQAHAAIAVLEYQSGRRRYCNEHITQACEMADASEDPTAIARAYTDSAMLALIGSDLDGAAASAVRVSDVAEAAGLDEFVTAGRILAAAGPCLRGEAGARERVIEHAEAARRGGWHELAWRGYVLLFAADFEQCNVRGAQRVIDEVLAWATERDLPVARHWHLAFRGLVHFNLARWNAALEDAEAVKDEAVFGAMWPDFMIGLVALRLGHDGAAAALDDMWTKTRGLDEPLRYLPALCALAEAMWMTGTPDPRVTDFAVSRYDELTTSLDTGWSAGNLALWLRRVGIHVEAPAHVAEPHRLVLAGRHAEAAAIWRSMGDPVAEAMALADSPEPEHRVAAVALLDAIGATATADRLRIELRRQGLTMVPQRPRESTRANPGGLTNRQLDVARLVAQGFSNQEIATRLYISTKTADHHVSAILMKLAVPNRRAVVQQAAALGLD